jgi:hypothetical protein
MPPQGARILKVGACILVMARPQADTFARGEAQGGDVSPDEVADIIVQRMRETLLAAFEKLADEQEARIRRECLALHGLNGTPHPIASEATEPVGIGW